MRLADLILLEMEAILARWEGFARTLLPAAAGMNRAALRDHARQILEAAARVSAIGISEPLRDRVIDINEPVNDRHIGATW